MSKAKAIAVPQEESPIVLPPMNVQQMKLRLVGDSPLISHAWSAKAKKMILDKQMKKPKAAKEAKDPEALFRESLYIIAPANGTPEKYGFPAVAFKSSAVDACSHVDGVTKVKARGAFHIVGEMITLEGTPTMREDMVRVGMGVADIRFRGEFKKWGCELLIRFNANVLSAGEIVNLFNTAGFAIGVGDWRPQTNGSYGMFHVETV